ncbi:MAG: DUF948 domain-containing protein [Propionibacteriaceae bacterium]|nr:DUF948 domain-containing protein [Propionibacteriaceae bacterium]
MSAGEIAGLIAAGALLLLVLLCAVPLLKLGGVLGEMRRQVRDLGEETVPILTELKGTVSATNVELEKLAVVTEDAARVSGHAAEVARNAADFSSLFKETVGGPLVKLSAVGYGVRRAIGPGPKQRKS